MCPYVRTNDFEYTQTNNTQIMINKTLYTPPVVEVLPIQAEGPLCASGEIPGYTVDDSYTPVWL